MLGFGLARLVESNNNITAEGALVGIGPYSCPESGMEKADITGDIYSLGAVFYHMLAGRPPFLGRDALDYLYKHRNEEVWPVRDLASSAMPKAVDELVNAMLDKNKKTRIQTPSELIACIDAIISPDVIRVKEDKKPRKESTIVFTTREMIASRRDYNIIIYDSHDYCRRLIHEVLFRQGFVSNVASSVDEINKFTDENKPDAVFIDVPAGVAGVEKILKKIILLNSEVAIVLTRGGSMAQKLFDKISSDESYKGEVSILQRPLEAESVRRSAYIGLKIGR
jgi:serine/threonine protein kinase